MIHTAFLDGQGLGNQLWAYAASRGIAEELDRPHVVTGRDQFKAHGILEIDWGQQDLLLDGPISQYHEELFYDSDLKYFASDFDQNVLSLPVRCQINGNFQDERYFFGRLNALSKWIRVDISVQERAKRFSNAIVLNIRGGEYKRHHGLILPKSYWINAMRLLEDMTGNNCFIIVTDDPRYARSIFPKIEVVSGIADSWAALRGCSALAVSNSSFAYFPIKTRPDTPLVIAPACWSRFNNPYSRWASPANYYPEWAWMGAEGDLYNSAQCLSLVEGTRSFYKNFPIRISVEHGVGKTYLGRVPKWAKAPVKKLARTLFPRKFG